MAWLDKPGSDVVIARLSRSLGLPRQFPDVLGLALRVPVDTGYGDVLLASTGAGRWGRFVLRPALAYERAQYSSLFPFRTPSGPILLAAFPKPDPMGDFDLAWARPLGAWEHFGTLQLGQEPDQAQNAAVSYDPVVNTLPGLDSYPWATRLRRYSYSAARLAREDSSLSRRPPDGDSGV